MKTRVALALLLVALTALFAAGCGSSSSTSDTSSAEASTSTSDSTSSSEAGTTQSGGSSKPAAGFGKGELQEFGVEAEPAELEAASEVLAENLEARETKDWAGQCASLSAAVVKVVESEAPALGAKKGCAARLEEQAARAPAILFQDTLQGEQIGALRVKGASAYALYHGGDGKDYAMPMKLEDGEWKVDSLTTTLMSTS